MRKGWPWYTVGMMGFAGFFGLMGMLLLGRLEAGALVGLGMAVLSAAVGLAALIQGDIRADKG